MQTRDLKVTDGAAAGAWIIAWADRRLARLGVYRSDSRPLVKLQSLLAAVAVVTVALLVLDGILMRWRNGSGSVGVEVLWRVVWVVYTLAKLILVAVLIATIRQWFASRRRSSGHESGVHLDRVRRWSEVPWSLWAFVALTTGDVIVPLATSSGPVGPWIFLVAFTLAWNYFMLRALRWLWIATIVVFAVFTGIDLITSTATWFGTLLGLIELALLLLPPTRRFFGAANSTPVLQERQEG